MLGYGLQAIIPYDKLNEIWKLTNRSDSSPPETNEICKLFVFTTYVGANVGSALICIKVKETAKVRLNTLLFPYLTLLNLTGGIMNVAWTQSQNYPNVKNMFCLAPPGYY